MSGTAAKLAAALYVVSLLAMGCGLEARSSAAGVAAADNAITASIVQKISTDPALSSQDIQVSTDHGVVTLTGTVATDQQQESVDRIASLEPGVVKVVDGLNVGSQNAGSSASTQAQPASPAPPPTEEEQRDQQGAPPPASNPPPVATQSRPAASQPAPQGPPLYSSHSGPSQMQSVPPRLTLPAGTLVTIRVEQEISSNRNRQGDAFSATLYQPLVSHGWVMMRHGQTVVGRVAVAKKGGRVRGVSELGLVLDQITLVDGQQVTIRTRLVRASPGGSKARDASAVGATTGAGAVIGGIAGGGEGAGIGAAIGAAAGVAGVLFTRGYPTVVRPETLLTFRMESPVTIWTALSQAAFRPVTEQDYPNQERPSGPGRYASRPLRPYGYPPPPPPYWAYYGSYYYPYYGYYRWGGAPVWRSYRYPRYYRHEYREHYGRGYGRGGEHHDR